MSLPSLDDLKAHLNKTSNTDDAELLDTLDAAVNVVEGITGPITTVPVTETHYGVSSNMIVLRNAPVSGLSAVAARAFAGSAPVAYSVADYVLDGATGVLRMASGYWFYGDVTVTYSAGRTEIPAAVRLAILIVAKHLWETQRGISPTALQEPDPTAFGNPAGYAIPNRARELLDAYKRSPRVA